MTKVCEACEYVTRPVHLVLQTPYWNVEMGNNHAYFGRAYMTLRQHKGSLSELSTEEWADFRHQVQRLEAAYKAAFGAEPMNWSCLMNNAYQEDPANPHVHWHIYPRYKIPVEFAGDTFPDELFGHFYNNEATHEVSDEVVAQMILKLQKHL